MGVGVGGGCGWGCCGEAMREGSESRGRGSCQAFSIIPYDKTLTRKSCDVA